MSIENAPLPDISRRESFRLFAALIGVNPLAAKTALLALLINGPTEAVETYLGVAAITTKFGDGMTQLFKPQETDGELDALRMELAGKDKKQVADFLAAKYIAGDRKTIQLAPQLINETNPEELGVWNATFGMHPEPFVSGDRKIFDGIVLFYQDLIRRANTNFELASETTVNATMIRDYATRTINDTFGFWQHMFENGRPLAAAAVLTSGLRNSEVRALLSPLNAANADQNLVRQTFATVAAYRSLMPAVAADEKFGEAFVNIVRSFRETLFLRMLEGPAQKKEELLSSLINVSGSDRVSELDKYIRENMLSKAMSGSLFLKGSGFQQWGGSNAIVGYGNSVNDVQDSTPVAIGSVLRNVANDAVFEVVSMEYKSYSPLYKESYITVRVHLPENKTLEPPDSGLLGWFPLDWDSAGGPVGKNQLKSLQDVIKNDGLIKIKVEKPEELIYHLAQPFEQDERDSAATPLAPIGLLWLFAQMCKDTTLYSLDTPIIKDGKVIIPTYRSVRPHRIILDNEGPAKIELFVSGVDNREPLAAQPFTIPTEETVDADSFVRSMSTSDFDWKSLALIVGLELASEAGLIKKLVDKLPEIAEKAPQVAAAVVAITLKTTQKGVQFLVAKGPGIAEAVAKGALKAGEKSLKLYIKALKTGIKVIQVPFKLFKEAVEVVNKFRDEQWMAQIIEWFSRGTGRWGMPFSYNAPHGDTPPSQIDTQALVHFINEKSSESYFA